MKHFVKAMNKNGEEVLYLKAIFVKLSNAKLQEGIFIDPHICLFMKNSTFDQKLSAEDDAHGHH